MEGNLRFKIDWANLTVGRKFTVFACFTSYLRAYIWRGDLTHGFSRCKFGGPIFRGAYT